jgi:DNA-binding beta-propeller fold protein YncE
MLTTVRHISIIALAIADLCGPLASAQPVKAAEPSEIMAVGIDGKFAYSNGRREALAPGHDQVIFYELKNPAKPAEIGRITLENSVVGPPTNIAITPDQKVALIANSLHSERSADGTNWRAVPSDELFIVDLAGPRLASIVKVGRQPSGIALNREGTLALVANRDSKSVSVLAIHGFNVEVTDTIDMIDTVGSVAITPDGLHALVTKTLAHKVSVLNIDCGKVSFERDLWVGLFPWNVEITPSGDLALINNIGNMGQSDGTPDTVSVIDLKAGPIRVIDHVTVGDAPEGLAISPKGDLAAITLLNGSYDSPDAAWYRHDVGRVGLLKIDQNKVSWRGGLDVGSFPEGIAYSANGDFVYAGNFASNSVSILHVSASGELLDTHEPINLPGSPGSLRIGSR